MGPVAEQERQRLTTAEIAPKVSDLVAAAQRRFRLLAVIGAVDLTALGLALGWLLDSLTTYGAAGGIVGFVTFLAATNWASKLDQSPRGLHLVKARNGAAVCLLIVPFAPLIAWPLLKRLAHPVLVKHAVTNHPDAGKKEDEQVIDTIRVRSAFITLRTTGLVLLASAAVVGYMYADFGGLKEVALGSAIVVGIVAALQVVAGFAGTKILLAMPPDAARRVSVWATLVWPVPPFGTYAAWSARRAFTGSRHAAPPGE